MKPHFHIGKMPVRVDPFFFLMAVALWSMDRGGSRDHMVETGLIWLVVVFTGVLLHELGHALVGKVFGLTPRITLYGAGGVTSWERGRNVGPTRSILISVAGPAVGITIGVLALVLRAHFPPPSALADYAFEKVVWVNLGWGVLNLVPMQPLDGGNVMASMCELVSRKKGPRVARIVSIAVGALIIAWLISTRNVIMALFVGSMAITNFKALRVEHAIGDDAQLRPVLTDAFDALKRREAEVVQTLAEKIRAEATTDAMRAQAAQLIAWSWFLRADFAAALEALKGAPSGFEPDPGLEGAILLELGDADKALGKLVAAAEGGPSGFVDARLPRAFLATKRFKYAAIVFAGPVGDHVGPEAIFQIEHAAYEAGDFETAAKIGEALFKKTKDPLRAFNVACSLARSGKPTEALDWLQRAKDAGFSDTKLLDEDVDLAPVRALSRYRAYRESFAN